MTGDDAGGPYLPILLQASTKVPCRAMGIA